MEQSKIIDTLETYQWAARDSSGPVLSLLVLLLVQK